MKNLIIRFFEILIFFLFFPSFIYSQPIGEGELMIVNQSNINQISVRIYPSGAIFNGDFQYNMYAKYHVDNDINNIYIYPIYEYTLNTFNTVPYYIKANFDRTNTYQDCKFSLGYGAYQIEITEGTNIKTIYISYNDAKFCTGITNYYQKIRIDYYSNSDVRYRYIDI